MTFREWLEWMAKDAQPSDPYGKAYRRALKEFDQRFMPVWTKVLHEDEPKGYLEWHEYLDSEKEQGDERS